MELVTETQCQQAKRRVFVAVASRHSPPGGKRHHFDSAKAVRELGLPQNPVEEALAEAVRWMQTHGMTTQTH